MREEDKVFVVENGSMYNKDRDYIYDNFAIIYDKENGCLIKYGDYERGDMRKYYDHLIEKWRESGLGELAEQMVYMEFDRYDGILDIEEICTLANYIICVSALGEKLHNLLNSDETVIKEEIARLKEIGF